MKLLLDTHTILWWFDSPGLVGKSAYALMADRRNELWVSPVVQWEIAIKANKHKQVPHALVTNFHAEMASEGLVAIGIDPLHAIRSGLLPFHHRDPFDRLLAAQSLEMNIPILSRDRIFDDYGVQRIW